MLACVLSFPQVIGDGCMIMKVHEPEHPLSKIEVRRKRLERMKLDSVQSCSYSQPSLEEIRSGKWLSDMQSCK